MRSTKNLKTPLRLAITTFFFLFAFFLFKTEVKAEVRQTGTWKNASWVIEDDVLTISGTGELDKVYNYGFYDLVEQYDKWFLLEDVKHLVIEKGFSSIKGIENFSSLETITFPDGLSSVGRIFDCCGITSLIFPEGITTIGNIDYCTKLNQIVFPQSATTIGDIQNCNSLTEINYPQNVKKTGSIVSCGNLTNIIYQEGVTEVGWFSNCAKLDLSDINFPKSIKKFGSVRYCDQLISFSIPEGVTYFEGFFRCNNLTTVTLPEGFKTLGSIEDCPKLTTITIPEGTITTSGFKNCSSLETIEFPDSIMYMGWKTFEGCSRLKNVKLSNGLKGLSTYDFRGCKGLTRISLPDNISSIPDHLFSGCDNLECIYIPKKVKTIEDKAFGDCLKLENIYYGGSEEDFKKIKIEKNNLPIRNATWHFNETLPEENREVGYDINYSWDEKSKKVTATATCWFNKDHVISEVRKADLISSEPATIEKAGKQIFKVSFKNNKFSEQIKEFDIPRLTGITVDGSTYNVDHTKKTSILTGVEENNILSYVIPDTIKVGEANYKVTEIKAQACKTLKKTENLIIGKNVTTIGEKAFYYCKELKNISFTGTKLKSIGEQAFKGVQKTVVVKCPKKKLNEYRLMLTESGIPSKATYTK